MIPLICRVLFFQGDKKDKLFWKQEREKNKIAFDGGVERRAKNTCFRVLVEMGVVGGERWART